MSRYYEMYVEVTGHKQSKRGAINDALDDFWDFSSEEFDSLNTGTKREVLFCTARGNLCGGEDEEEFAARLAGEVWKANAGYCVVKIRATYLEELPYEEHILGREDYEAWLETEEESKVS